MDTNIDITDSGIKYSGSVTIEYIDTKGQKRTLRHHNNGELPLFTAITRFLAGYSYADLVAYKPSSLMCYDTLGQKVLYQNVGFSSNPVTYISNSESSTGQTHITDGKSNDIVQYAFLIPANALVTRNRKIKILKLFNNNNDECASIDLGNNGISTATGANILIYWKLQFSNN